MNCGAFGVDLSFKQGLEPVSDGERRRWSMRVLSNELADWVRMWIFFVLYLIVYLFIFELDFWSRLNFFFFFHWIATKNWRI